MILGALNPVNIASRVLNITIKNMGYRSCYLETLDELKDAVRLYEAFGFRHFPERLGNTGHNSCGICMLRTL